MLTKWLPNFSTGIKIYQPRSKHHVYPILTIVNSVREVGRIVKSINQPMQYKLTRLKKTQMMIARNQI
jgi:hypothetical protein